MTAAALYMRQKKSSITLENISWKKDHQPKKNALSLYVGDKPLRDLTLSDTQSRMNNSWKLSAPAPQAIAIKTNLQFK
jgi:hypothetical protein